MASVDDASGGLNGAGMPQEEPLQLGQWRCSTPDLMALGVALELFGSAPMPPDLVKQAEEAVRGEAHLKLCRRGHWKCPVREPTVVQFGWCAPLRRLHRRGRLHALALARG